MEFDFGKRMDREERRNKLAQVTYTDRNKQLQWLPNIDNSIIWTEYLIGKIVNSDLWENYSVYFINLLLEY